MSGRKLAKRSCDACRVRKIKCSEIAPCNGCQAASIQCTFSKRQRKRGPRDLRSKTRDEIEQMQQRAESATSSVTQEATMSSERAASDSGTRVSEAESQQSIPIEITKTPNSSLTICLCVYRLRLFPIWPIISVEEVMACLHLEEEDPEVYALANAVGAATIAQLKLDIAGANVGIGSKMAQECERAKQLINSGNALTLNSIRIAFFLHVFHENQLGGGVQSLMYLREAITMAQIMGLDRESTIVDLPFSEQQTRRRILWLLFVTERGVAMLHKLPVILKPSTGFPSIENDNEAPIFVAVQKLVNLFWIFDQSGAFDILRNSESGLSSIGEIETASRQCLDILQIRLQNVPLDPVLSNDVQRADICVTRQWMLAKIWMVSMNRGRATSTSSTAKGGLDPVQIAKDFLKSISLLPKAAIESHGPTMEFKVYEIACAVTDSLASEPFSNTNEDACNILGQLQQLLTSIRGGNKTLSSMLSARFVGVSQHLQIGGSDSLYNSMPDRNWSINDNSQSGTTTSNFGTHRRPDPSEVLGSTSYNALDDHQGDDVIELERNDRPSLEDPTQKSFGIPFMDAFWVPTTNERGPITDVSARQVYSDADPMSFLSGDVQPADILNSFLSTSFPWGG